ncbi:sugar phosphate isomerase [Prauserella marina]|uniref:Sugar phosphate isomerase/epimerase n=1 Tax=Prauserella marina TaxID=530584 RepID=A0A222VM64_9PSEU|nr:EboA domain-containing protein [Prauserella marina]ASR34967.1 sugar phosphate isomerase [Prauserella marina]PWV85312.1 sugar phosphate isomerase/epimerase [Prauserella marina]SDC57758.1 Sugar phosphate isomerase/epimerase [Prauserella marina]
MTLRFGYGTNGFANHRLDEALRIIADLGYTGVALTLDHAHLDPFADDVAAETSRVAGLLDRLGLSVVVETGARFLLDPLRKHQPTLVSADPAARIDFLLRAGRIAAELGADCVSFWSGVAPSDVDEPVAWSRLAEGVEAVLSDGGLAEAGVRYALEPEPGHFVQHVEQALELRHTLGSPERLGITLDVGHCVAVEPVSAAECVRQVGGLLFNVQLDDMLPGVHEHLEFGEGGLDLVETVAALAEVGYPGLAAIELPRHSHAAPDVARRGIEALRAAEWISSARRDIAADPVKIRTLFPSVGRMAGRSAPEGSGLIEGTVDDKARVNLLAALPPADLAAEITALYRYGDGAERRGVLRGLHLLPEDAIEAGLRLVEDALRANDTGLVAAALGPFAARHLDAHTWRHGVLKCLFTGVPLAAVSGLAERADEELVRMVADFAAERRAAGRAVPGDAEAIIKEATA